MQLFKSFFMGGYECADMINRRGKRVDLLALTRHHNRTDKDYALLTGLGIHTVREGIRWSVVEKEPYRYDFSEVKNRILAAQRAGIQQLWDICHFGFPDDLAPTDPKFMDRFVAICKAFTEFYRLCTDDPLIITPINEISFLSYISGDVACTVPFLSNSGGLIKYQLCKATIKAIEAIKSMEPAAKILMVEPLIRIHPPEGQDLPNHWENYNEGQFEAMDIITGRLYPELGGQPQYVDLAGFNYYYNNQWCIDGQEICWKTQKEFRNFPGLLKEAANRYGKPVVLSETGHFAGRNGKDERALWMQHITEECIAAMEMGVDLRGICIYPVLDRPDWDYTKKYIPCGIWGYNKKTKKRFAEATYLNMVKRCMGKMQKYNADQMTEVQERFAA
jgi:beta-glucosidase/6-phospho-beta-glucosidase/beta-galactosidase